jgi:hypothetical protein
VLIRDSQTEVRDTHFISSNKLINLFFNCSLNHYQDRELYFIEPSW